MDPGIAHTTHGLAQRGYGATVSGRWGQGIVQSNTTPKFLVKHTHTRVVPPKSNPPPLSHLPHLKYLQKSNRICPYTATSAIEREKDKKKKCSPSKSLSLLLSPSLASAKPGAQPPFAPAMPPPASLLERSPLQLPRPPSWGAILRMAAVRPLVPRWRWRLRRECFLEQPS